VITDANVALTDKLSSLEDGQMVVGDGRVAIRVGEETHNPIRALKV